MLAFEIRGYQNVSFFNVVGKGSWVEREVGKFLIYHQEKGQAYPSVINNSRHQIALVLKKLKSSGNKFDARDYFRSNDPCNFGIFGYSYTR